MSANTRIPGLLMRLHGIDVSKYDGVFLQVRASLAPFVEPLLEELFVKNIFVNCRTGSYFAAMNEPYQFVSLALAGIPTPRTLTSGSGKNIERVSGKISYPLLAKSFLGKEVQQSLVVSTEKELRLFVNSIKSNVDGFMLREFIESDVATCVVIGEKVFAVKRKTKGEKVFEIAESVYYKPTDDEQKTALDAARALGFDIARIDLARGRVVKVDPMVPWPALDSVCSEVLEDHVASFFIEKIKQRGAKPNIVDDIIEVKNIFSKTIFSRFFK